MANFFDDIASVATAATAGLPNWAWGLIVAGGAGAGILINRNMSASSAAAPSASGVVDPAAPGAGPPQYPGPSTAPGGSNSQPPGSGGILGTGGGIGRPPPGHKPFPVPGVSPGNFAANVNQRRRRVAP